MSQSQFHITQASLDKFKQELDDLKQQLTEVIALVASAREQGDLSENSEYQSAKNEQDIINNRIAELENILRNHVLVDDSKKSQVSITDLGSTIYLKNLDNNEKQVFKLVGTYEVNPFENKISVASEVGKRLIGKVVGDEVSFPSTEEMITYQITAIE